LSFDSVPAAIAERLDAVRPVIVQNAERGAAERRIPSESIDALEEAGLFRTMVPRRFGADPSARLCGALNPAGQAERVPGGFKISGRWTYVSASLHAQWAVLGVSVQAGPPESWEHYEALVPMAELTIHDTWWTAGMRGTGSNTLTCEDVCVPEHRMLSFSDAMAGRYATEYKDEVTYRAAMLPMATLVLAGPVLGIGRAALQHVRTAAAEKGIVATFFARQAQSAGFQIQWPRPRCRIDSAQLHAYRAAADIERHAAADTVPDYLTRARIRADTAMAGGYVTSAVSTLLDAHGSGGFAESNPLHRMWQDANVGARHALLNATVSNEVYGKALLGVENDVSPAV
jgi:3-hydroxy-9,10-secoandrosta-1,3,5(10)-triene-9,17-dione monooxygenase